MSDVKWLDKRYTALDIARSIAVIIVIIVVILFVMIQRRYGDNSGGCHTYLGYSVVGGQRVAGLAVRKRDMERAGVSIQMARRFRWCWKHHI
jgi:hypothetical protein